MVAPAAVEAAVAPHPLAVHPQRQFRSSTFSCSPWRQSVYDRVCEINKLSDVGTSGWQVRYPDRFFHR